MISRPEMEGFDHWQICHSSPGYIFGLFSVPAPPYCFATRWGFFCEIHLTVGDARTGVMTPVRKEIVFRGRVQGVGFRYTAKLVAERYAVTGWVRNRHDGCVEMLVEGSSAESAEFIDEVISTVNDGGFGNVESHECSPDLDATGEFISFGIRL